MCTGVETLISLGAESAINAELPVLMVGMYFFDEYMHTRAMIIHVDETKLNCFAKGLARM